MNGTHMARHVREVAVTVTAALALMAAMLVGMPSGAASALVIDNGGATSGWRPVPTAGITSPAVFAIARLGSMMVIGGNFDRLVSPTGTTADRDNLAALDATTGALLPWAPNPDGPVRALASDGGTGLYIGGRFATFGGAAHGGLVRVTGTGAVVPGFAPGAVDGTVRALALHGGSLYVGGIFSHVGVLGRAGGAALDPANGAVKAWNPGTNAGIFTLMPTASGIFIGGPFKRVRENPAFRYLAKLNLTTGEVVPSWNYPLTCVDPGPDPEICAVFSVVTDGPTVYAAAGGLGGRVTAFDATTGAQRWLTHGDGDSQVLALSGDTLLVGGHFDGDFGGADRSGLAAMNKATGAVLPNPSVAVTGEPGVWALLIEGARLHVGGHFNRVNGAQIGRYTTFPVTDVPVVKPPVVKPPVVKPPVVKPPVVAKPRPPVKVTLTTTKARSKVKVNVNPNLRGSRYWTFRVQQRTVAGWVYRAGAYRTKGHGETRTVNLPRGTYRVVVLAKYGHRATASRAVSLVR